MLGPASPVAYIIAAIATTLIVMCFAEAGSMFDRTGGPYLYAREAFGPFLGFEVGWMFLLSRLAAAAAISNAFASYLGYLWPPMGSGAGRVVAITVLLAGLTLINLMGIRYGSRAVNLLTLGKMVPLLLFISAGLFFVDSSRYEFFALPEMSSLQQASLALIFAFGGFDIVVARVLVLPEANGVENKEFQFGANVANRSQAGLLEVQLRLPCDVARIARIWLVQDRVQHVADQRQRWCRAKRIDECRGRVRPDQHVGLVYFLESTNGRAVEPDAGRE